MFVDHCNLVKNPHKPTRRPFKSKIYYQIRNANTFLLLSELFRQEHSGDNILLSRCRNSVLKKQLVLLCTFVHSFSPTRFYSKYVTISENHQITEWSWLKGMLSDHLHQCPFLSRVSRFSCPGTCPDGFWTYSRMETPQPPWTACDQSISQ